MAFFLTFTNYFKMNKIIYEILDLIEDGLQNTGNISEELRNKVMNKSNVYIQDISDYLYDIEVSLIGV